MWSGAVLREAVMMFMTAGATSGQARESEAAERDSAGWTQARLRAGAQRTPVLVLCAVLAGCISTRVEYFTDETFPSRDPVDSVEWLTAEPSRPYVRIARISVDSANAAPEVLREALLAQARRLGAEAVIDEKAVVVASRVGSPNYESGVLGPEGASFGLYGYGWYTPYSSDPYLFTQGATDQPKFDKYVTVIAIRYRQVSQNMGSE
jgi:hypothetical protein